MTAEAENDTDIDAGGGDDQDDLAAEWESMMSPDATSDQEAGGGAPAGRVLSQAEIDSLLGNSNELDQDIESTGVKAMLNNAISYERLPMLEVVFDRMVSYMSTSLRNFTADNVEVSMEAISSTRVGDYLNSIPLPAMISAFARCRDLTKPLSTIKVSSRVLFLRPLFNFFAI